MAVGKKEHRKDPGHVACAGSIPTSTYPRPIIAQGSNALTLSRLKPVLQAVGCYVFNGNQVSVGAKAELWRRMVVMVTQQSQLT